MLALLLLLPGGACRTGAGLTALLGVPDVVQLLLLLLLLKRFDCCCCCC
jgi:hypothetical protein